MKIYQPSIFVVIVNNMETTNIPHEYREHVFKITGGFGKQIKEEIVKPIGKLDMDMDTQIDLLENLIFGHNI